MAELVLDPRTGDLRLVGEIPADATMQPIPAPAAPKPVKAKPPKAQPKPRGFWGQIGNDLSYEFKATFMGGRAGAARAAKNLATYPGRLWLLQHSAIAEVQRNAIEAVQRLRGAPRGDYAASNYGAGVDRYEDMIYRRFGLTPPSQQQGTEALLTGFGAEAATQVGMAAVGGAVLSRAARVAPALRPVQSLLNPAAGKTAVGKVGRFAAAAVADEAATAPLVNNTGGSAVSLVNMVLGTNMADPVTPEMDRIESMRAGFVPNTAFSLLAGGGLLAGASALGRFRRGVTATSQQTRARERLQQQGVTMRDPETGAEGFAEKGKRPTWKDVERTLGIEDEPEAVAPPEPTPLPEPEVPVTPETPDPAEPPGAIVPTRAIDPMAMDEVLPWEVPYDPALPEADTLLRAIDDTLTPDEITELAQGSGPVLEQLEELVTNRQPVDVNPDRSFENGAVPRGAVSQRYLDGYRDQLEAMEFEELRDLAINSPEVSYKATEVTGKAPEEFTKTDIIEGLLAIPDQVVLSNRVAGRQLSPMLRVDEIEVDPVRFQFKGNTDQAGVQAGNSLEGVERWNPDAEGLIQVWTDPKNGRTYVVNGHNRLAKARQLGVGTMRVTYLNARTAEQARAMGAMANIAEGGGTAFDAAKFLRESGITSTKQLKELGANLSDQRNLWVPGLALSRLPEDTFLMAVNGTLDLDDAVMIGKSGLSPETMGEVAKVAVRRGWTGEKLGEMLAQGDATRATADQGSQVDLFGNAEVVNRQELKADLAIRVKALLRADRNAFRSASRNADKLRKGGNVIDEATSGAIADDAAAALKAYDQLKYQASEVGRLLNEGVEELAGGAQLEPIAARISREVPAAIEVEMGRAMPKGRGTPIANALGADLNELGQALGRQARRTGEFIQKQGKRLEERQAAALESLDELEAEIDQAAKLRQQWEALPQVRRDAKAAEARKALLTERKRANREAKKAELDERTSRALEWMDDDLALQQGQMTPAAYRKKWGDPNSEEPPVTAPTKAEQRPIRELEEDQAARAYLEWYDAQPRQRLQGQALEKAKAAIVSRAIDAEEVRPPATPIPEPLPVPDVDLQAAADELLRNEIGPNVENMVGTELVLREAYGLQDTQLQNMQLEAERAASGYEAKTLEEVLPEVTEVFLSDEPIPARPAPAVRADQLQPDSEDLGDQIMDRKTISRYQPTALEEAALRSAGANDEQLLALRTGAMRVMDAEALLEAVPDAPGAPRRVRTKLEQRINKAADEALEELLASLPETPEVAPGPSIADTFEEAMRAMAQSDARLYRGLGEFLSETRRLVDELDDTVPAAGEVIDVPAAAVDEVVKALPPGKAGQPAKKKLAQARKKLRKAAEGGPDEQRAALNELRDTAAEIADEQVASINAEIDTIRTRAQEEGC